MMQLTQYGQGVVNDIANRYGISRDAVTTLLVAVNHGGGTQAQFSHPELGGMSQWSRGGMIMVGDMFNNGLKYTVDSLCNELSNALANGQVFPPPPPPRYAPMSSQSQSQSSGGYGGASYTSSQGPQGSSWPPELGQPSSVGAQNNLRYAVFPQTNRLAIDNGGQLSVYDLGDHQVYGFSQQQGGDQSITFTSQYGTVRVADLPRVDPGASQAAQAAPAPEPAAPPPQPDQPAPAAASAPEQQAPAAPSVPDNSAEIFQMIEQLAQLREKGILTDEEFDKKKAELLSRL